MALFISEEGSMGKREPKIIGKKLRGEWAEMIFMLRATEHGLQVSKPWGDSRSYDFVVGRPRHFVAVQVKSTIFELEEGWMCTVCSSSKPYPPGSFDFLAAYVVFEDAWYIIPEEKVLGMKSVSLHTKCNQSKYERYRDAWELLERDLKPGPPEGEIDSIQGCAEEFSMEWVE
jgi:PD-(D/E)XK nuclease superfamily protein